MPELTIEQAFAIALQHHQAGRLTEAEQLYRIILAKQPQQADVLHLSGVVAAQRGQHELAAEVIARAIALNPSSADYHSNLGNALFEMGKGDQAIEAYQRALALRPNSPQTLNNLGLALRKEGRVDPAIEAYQQAIRIQPDYADAYNSLGNYYKDQGLLELALEYYHKALALEPAADKYHSNILYSLHFHPDHDAQSLLAESRRWAARYADLPPALDQPYENDPSPARRLRIGYVSPDFRDHVIGRNLLPLLREHDHQVVEVICYSNGNKADAFTAQFRAHADGWRDIASLDGAQAVKLIRDDRIDILVDLALHMSRNRLRVFAAKPAPVQATFAGYPGGTGLKAIDYRLTDPYLDPPGDADSDYVEQSIHLPHSFWCYDLAAMSMGLESQPSVGPLPADAAGFVTFGCLNNFCKINDRVLVLWAQVLKSVKDSRLIMLAEQGSHRARVLDFLAREGIDPARIEFKVPRARTQYLEYYNRIDIGLDTLPYNGHTTSLDSLWMGVPVVTLAGETVVGRAGVSQLSNLGLTELIAQTARQYVQIAGALAVDLKRLAGLRSQLRTRMQGSPLMDAAGFARGIEAAYRQMWRKWCERRGQQQ